MNQKSKRFYGLIGIFGIAVLLLGVLFGAASAAPAATGQSAPVAFTHAGTLLQAAAQVIGSVQTQPGQPAGQGNGPTTTTTNVNVGIPGWVWIIAVLLLVVIVALIAAGNRGGGGGTTIIKD